MKSSDAQPANDPYVPTPIPRITALLDLAHVGSGDLFLDLGAGDGRVVRTAQQCGAIATGVECDEVFAGDAIIIGDFWQHDWAPYTVVFASVRAALRNPIVDRWRALSHRNGDRLIVLADHRYAEVHIACGT